MSYLEELNKHKELTRCVGSRSRVVSINIARNVCKKADKEIEDMKKVLIEVMRLLKNGANGAIHDTIWSDCLYESQDEIKAEIEELKKKIGK